MKYVGFVSVECFLYPIFDIVHSSPQTNKGTAVVVFCQPWLFVRAMWYFCFFDVMKKDHVRDPR